MSKKINIIVPYYNAEPYLDRCLQSLIDNEGDFLFLLVNDKSTDNSLEIAKKYAQKDERILLLYNRGHGKGVSVARNIGLDFVVQGYVTFLDADDALAQNAYESYMKAMNFYPSFNSYIQMNHLRYYSKIDKLALKYTNPTGLYTLEKMPQLWEFVTNKLYSTDLVKDIRFREGMQWGEDELFNLQVLAKTGGRLVCTWEHAMVHHFDNPNSLSKSKGQDALLDQIHILEEFLLKQEDVALRRFLCEWIGYHWTTETYKSGIGGNK